MIEKNRKKRASKENEKRMDLRKTCHADCSKQESV